MWAQRGPRASLVRIGHESPNPPPHAAASVSTSASDALAVDAATAADAAVPSADAPSLASPAALRRFIALGRRSAS